MILTKLKKQNFDRLFELMQEAFPPEEYRPKEKQYAILDDENYFVAVAEDEEKIIAFLAIWRLDGFDFAEHFAVDKTLRGKGIGGEFLREYLKKSERPLVLEVENAEDEISKRRISFYQRNGLSLSDICYDQPNFQCSEKKIPLRIMYSENGKTLDLARVKDTIFRLVYKQKV